MDSADRLIAQNYLQCNKIIQAMQVEITQLPKGNLTYRNPEKYHYCHLQFYDTQGHRHNHRIPDAEIEKMKQLLNRRDTLKKDIQKLQHYMKTLEKTFPYLLSLNTTAQSTELVAPDPSKPYHTLKGDFVRSKSEVIIADELYVNQISYEYEKPITLNGWNYPVRPDFTICTPKENRIIYWEHCGLMNDADYRAKWERKKKAYERTGISEWNKNLIVTYESQGNDLDIYGIRQHIAQISLL